MAMNNMFRGSARSRASIRKKNEEQRLDKNHQNNVSSSKPEEKQEDKEEIEPKENYAKEYKTPEVKEENVPLVDVIRLPKFKPEKESKKEVHHHKKIDYHCSGMFTISLQS